jgi:hypothetical protein
MRRLLFSASFLLVLGACGQKITDSEADTTQVQETEVEEMETAPVVEDTLRIVKKTGEVAGHAESNGQLNEPETTPDELHEAPKHNAPGQSAIDSIKAA